MNSNCRLCNWIFCLLLLSPMGAPASALRSPSDNLPSAAGASAQRPYGPADMAGASAPDNPTAAAPQGPSPKDQLLGAVEKTRAMDKELESLGKTFPMVAQDVSKARELVKAIMRRIASSPGMAEPKGPEMVG